MAAYGSGIYGAGIYGVGAGAIIVVPRFGGVIVTVPPDTIRVAATLGDDPIGVVVAPRPDTIGVVVTTETDPIGVVVTPGDDFETGAKP